jgi:Outer membrane protein beta-barrel domain
MTSKWLTIGVVMALAMPGAAAAQEVTGAQRIEIGSALFGGGVLFVPSSSASGPVSRSYIVSGAVTTNVNRWIGVEGDIGLALGSNAAHSVYGVLPTNSNRVLPNALLYSANVVYNPVGSDRKLIPYVSAGGGALTTFALASGSQFGLEGNATYPTASAGGGIRWFPIPHWGVRGDYRFMGIRHEAPTDPGPESRVVRSAHRIYGALVLTF